MIDINKVYRQSQFCQNLMDRLDDDIKNAGIKYGAMEKYTAVQSDIVRLRRELRTLSELLDPWRQPK